MLHKKIRIPKDSANEILFALGKLKNSIEFEDLTKNDLEAKKSFGDMIKRCDEVKKKIDEFIQICNEFLLPIDNSSSFNELNSKLSEDIKERDKKFGQTYFDLIEGEILKNDRKISELVDSHEQVRENLNTLFEKNHVLQKVTELITDNAVYGNFGESQSEEDGIMSSTNTNLVLMAGIIPIEYESLFDDIRYGLYPTPEKIFELNGKLMQKSIKYGTEYQDQKEKYQDYLNTIKMSKEPNKEVRQKGQRPRTCKCPLCGTEFAIASWKIHIKGCRNKEIKRQEYLPKKYWKDVDKIIENFMKGLEGGNTKTKIKASGKYDVDNLNEEAFVSNNNDLVQCSSCGRSFLPERLAAHQKICFKHPEMFKKK